jgi:N6-adenosine-specific RNA methylase IME4
LGFWGFGVVISMPTTKISEEATKILMGRDDSMRASAENIFGL